VVFSGIDQSKGFASPIGIDDRVTDDFAIKINIGDSVSGDRRVFHGVWCAQNDFQQEIFLRLRGQSEARNGPGSNQAIRTKGNVIPG